MKQNAIQAVIFDLDGTLVRSEHIYHQSEKWLSDKLQLQHYTETPSSLIGASSEEYMSWFRETHQLDMGVRALCQLQAQIFIETGLQLVETIQPVIEFLEVLHTQYPHIPKGVASGSEHNVIIAILEHIQVRQYFDVIFSCSQVERSKPYPDVYTKCVNTLNIPAQHCLAIEDSLRGFHSAKSAGLNVITLSHSTPLEDTIKTAREEVRSTAGNSDFHFPTINSFESKIIFENFPFAQFEQTQQ